MTDPINPYNHIDLRVPRMGEVLPFYEALLPALGFTVTSHDPEWKVFVTGKARTPSTAYFGLTEDRDHKPNGTRIAFWVPTRADVDRLARIVTQSGGRNVSGPKACPDYSPTYYAVFFDDPCGNRLEICHREN